LHVSSRCFVAFSLCCSRIWGGGFLGKWGTLDFAGGIVIHASAGIGSLLVALHLGRRKHFYDFMGEFPPSNLPLAATGGALLWIGWFGFNGQIQSTLGVVQSNNYEERKDPSGWV